MSQFVLQPWVGTIGLKMQSILISGLRAPDAKTDAVKKSVRWLRSKCQIDADPRKQSYMQTIEMNNDLISAAVDELEYLTCHYTHHFADAFAVVACYHPELNTNLLCMRMHNLIAEEIFHFKPELREAFLHRHRDQL